MNSNYKQNIKCNCYLLFGFTGVIKLNTMDFSKIREALETSYKALLSEAGQEISVMDNISQAQDEYLQALSHATSVEKDYLRYTK